MKKLVLFLALGFTSFVYCNKDETVILSEQEKSDLLFLREEEKLARDVYIFSYNKYGQRIFNNISSSEQTHMSSVLTLLNKYGIADPVANNGTGVFTNSELQKMYNDLTSASNTSLMKAFEVGANIEDIDIRDINIFKSHTTKSDINSVYDKLTCGSRNHMRSFVGQIGNYTPIYISQSQYDAIINSSNEQCGN